MSVVKANVQLFKARELYPSLLESCRSRKCEDIGLIAALPATSVVS